MSTAPQLEERVRESYSLRALGELEDFLKRQGALDLPTLSSGLFPASVVSETSSYTGYQAVWVRDNVHSAYSLWRRGQPRPAVRAVSALLRWFRGQQERLDDAIVSGCAAQDPANRPHVRFDGVSFREIPEKWNHAQNDALGYLLWLTGLLVEAGVFHLGAKDLEVLGRVALYLGSISYWCDEDSGHWEEQPKIEASSIGTVVAGLRSFGNLVASSGPIVVPVDGVLRRVGPDEIDGWIALGRRALDEILPAECVQTKSAFRAVDAALLFLIYPLAEVGGAMAELVVKGVSEKLLGKFGVRRYSGDTFWSPDYRGLPPEIRTAPEALREAWFREPGHAGNRATRQTLGNEAQWCLFDSTLSCIYAERVRHGDERARSAQVWHLNRALRQLVSVEGGLGLRCPELYFLEGEKWVPNDVVPLLWGQANLGLALTAARSVAER